MAIIHVQGASSSNNNVVSFGVAVTSGNLIAGVFATTGTLTSISDDKGNSYTIVDTAGSVSSFYLANVTNAPTTITATNSNGSTGAALMVDEYSGVATTTPLDVHGIQSQTTPGTGADALSSGNITTTVDGDLIYGGSGNTQGVASNSTTAGTGYTLRGSTAVDIGASEDKVQTTHGAIAATFTNSTFGGSLTFTTFAMAFKAAGGAPPPASALKHYSNMDGIGASGPFFANPIG